MTNADLIHVLLPLPLAEPFTYRAGSAGPLAPGDIVEVPIGNRVSLGVVWDGTPAPLPEKAKLKDVLRRCDAPPIPQALRKLVDWVAAYTLNPTGAVLKMCLPEPRALIEPPPVRAVLRLGDASGVKASEQRERVLKIVRDQPGLSVTELAEAAAVSQAVVRKLLELGALVADQVPAFRPPAAPDWRRDGRALNTLQAEAAAALRAAAEAQDFSVTLLEGVTGAGKTEVYYEAVAAALARGRQVLVLLPEIALTQQSLDRFEQRFGAPAWAWHSEMAEGRRAATLRAISRGEAKVVIGARSALFLPYADLGLIVVDEEHDASYKQEEGVIYNARDMAVVRAKLEGIAVVLASATPSLESLHNVARRRYAHAVLPERHNAASLPRIQIVDMRKERLPTQRFISAPLVTALTETIAAGEQAMLFLNRRGYAPLTLCGACGHRLQCPNCAAWLVEHKRHGRLQCHHCGHQQRLPKNCPQCEAEDKFKACGPGVERLAEEAAMLFPDARLAVMASDTANTPRMIGEMLERMERREIDILIGTQIVAKGHHFPLLTLVGVIDADLGLAGGDPRAAERTHQLLTQVAGRAGRAAHPGRVLLQSFDPQHPVIAALSRHDTAGFLAAEMAERQRAGMPPFGRLAAVIISGTDQAEVEQAARALARVAPRGGGLSVLGPAPAPLHYLRGRYRERLLLKAEREIDVPAALREWMAKTKLPSGVKRTVDIDPYSFL
ncbi:primosomal protein N' [Ferrovibrio terrae]|uniref:primosomal protein N' n=1 Tax=Ferrovibrio terrae TaxID=2594003 RepID=UPI0031382289